MKNSSLAGAAAVAVAVTAAAVAVSARIDSTLPLPTMSENVMVRLLEPSGHLSGPVSVSKVVKSEAAWRAQLTPEQYAIARAHGTERAFCGVFHDNHKHGVYACIGCGLPLFRSDTKFDSGTGWPSFFEPIAKENLGETRDTKYGMVRTEVHCKRCGSHMGHVFPDGPAPTRLRYCINSEVLSFHERPAAVGGREKVAFGAGCFWGVESTFGAVGGVTGTRVGYAGGHATAPTYEAVCSHGTGHAEVVEVEYDPAVIPFDRLLEVFWASHNPRREQQNGPDEGDQYRSAVFFTAPEQEATVRASAEQLVGSGDGPVRTEISLLGTFYPAEEYHQQYYEKHGLKSCATP